MAKQKQSPVDILREDVKKVDNNSDMLVLISMPGKAEIDKKRPLVGGAGSIFDKILNYCRLKRYHFDFDHACKTKLPGDKQDVLFKHTNQGRFKCHKDWETLAANIKEQVKSYSLVIMLGAVPLCAVFGPEFTSVKTYRGYPFYFEGALCVPTIHPANLMPGGMPEYRWLVYADITKAIKIKNQGRDVKPFVYYIPGRGWEEETL